MVVPLFLNHIPDLRSNDFVFVAVMIHTVLTSGSEKHHSHAWNWFVCCSSGTTYVLSMLRDSAQQRLII